MNGGLPTPAELSNPPGAPALDYRVGTHGAFKASLAASLSRAPALRALTTRDDDDPTLALLDAWATVLDVVTFYQERIANEGYLRTATEERSVRALARAIGYEPRAGTAAGVHLAFELESGADAQASVRVPAGVRIQSVPGQDELPQVFETVEEIEARPEWNAMAVRTTSDVEAASGARECYVEGTTTGLRAGDVLLFVSGHRAGDPASDRWAVRPVGAVEPDPARGVTRVAWEEPLQSQLDGELIGAGLASMAVYVLRRRMALFGHNAPDWRTMPPQVRAVFGADATDWPGLSLARAGATGGAENAPDDVHLDASYPEVAAGSWVVLSVPDRAAPAGVRGELYRVAAAAEVARTDFTLTARTTRLTLSGVRLRDVFDRRVRDTTVLAQSERLALAEFPLEAPAQGERMWLTAPVGPLPAGRAVVVSGRRAWLAVAAWATGVALRPDERPDDVPLLPGEIVEVLAPSTFEGSEVVWRVLHRATGVGTVRAPYDALIAVPAGAEATTVTEVMTAAAPEWRAERYDHVWFTTPPAHALDRASLRIAGNVAWATHGESREEILGGGDAGTPHQRFVLRDAPVTHVPAATPTGGATTLVIRVDDVRWRELPSLHQAGPTDRVYTVRTTEDGRTEIRFGDGERGARLPSGVENVRAGYRVGAGLAGQVQAGRLMLPVTPPLGVRAVRNPLAAAGAADPEGRERTRRHAPQTVLAFDRIVSLQDVEDFAAAFSGIGKAQATPLWTREGRIVHLTVAADDGRPLPPDSPTLANLVDAIRAAGHSTLPIRVDAHVALVFGVSARLLVAPERDRDDVLAQAGDRLRGEFSFEQRDFGRPVAASEVVTVLQRGEGVLGVEALATPAALDPAGAARPAIDGILPARRAWVREDGTTVGAELLTIDPAGIALQAT